MTKVQPFKVIPLPKAGYHKSSLGKLSRAKVRKAFESGDFQSVDSKNMELISNYRKSHRQLPSTPAEKAVAKIVAQQLAINQNELSISDNILSLGLTATGYTDLCMALQKHFDLKRPLDLVMIFQDPTVRGITRAMEADSDAIEAYDPVVLQQPNGGKTPLWIVHPASGDVTSFKDLASYFSDRPVYGLRSKGVNREEQFFSSISEMITAYCASIQRTQPNGPYAIAGCDIGSTIAFEIAKLLEADGKEVRFVGAFNSPPDISSMTANLTWNASLVRASISLDLFPYSSATTLIRRLWHARSSEALDYVLSQANPERLASHHLDRDALSRAAGLTANFALMCADYVPQGNVSSIDVFIADPDPAHGLSSERWVDEHLAKWIGFARDRVRFHNCGGGHVDMMGGGFGGAFQRKVEAALVECGV